MGDELHNRTTRPRVFWPTPSPWGWRDRVPERAAVIGTLKYLTNHEVIFLGLAMAAGKAIADAARDMEYSTVVTAMAATASSSASESADWGRVVHRPGARREGLFLPGLLHEDAGLDMGDSAITETVGWGGFVLGGAPGILSLVGGTPEEALGYSREMRRITAGTHPTHRMPWRWGSSARRWKHPDPTRSRHRTDPHRRSPSATSARPGTPRSGPGWLRAPMECFQKALKAFGALHASR